MTIENLDPMHMRRHATRASALLKVLANDKRLLVLCDLAKNGERSVSELEEVSGLSQSALSQHLAKMRHHDIVTTRRAAQTIYYSLASPETRTVIDTLCAIFLAPDLSLTGQRPEERRAAAE